MAVFRYRAATAAGALSAGVLEGVSPAQVIDQLRRSGLTPIEVVEIEQIVAKLFPRNDTTLKLCQTHKVSLAKLPAIQTLPLQHSGWDG